MVTTAGVRYQHPHQNKIIFAVSLSAAGIHGNLNVKLLLINTQTPDLETRWAVMYKLRNAKTRT